MKRGGLYHLVQHSGGNTMNCTYLKQKFNKNLECKKDKNRIPFKDCKECPCKEYKNKGQKQLKQKTSKQAKLERERESIFTEDLEHCIICGRSPVNKHEIFGGRNRLNSIKYKLVIPLCIYEHHNQIECKGIHFDKKLRDDWHKKGQALFQETYPDLDFLQIFGKNYLD